MDSYEGNLSNPATINKYLFAQNQPTNYSDPFGNQVTVAEVGAEMVGLELSAAISGLALGALKEVERRIKYPIFAYHYTTFSRFEKIRFSGFILPGSDFNFFTDEIFDTGEEALNMLALYGFANRGEVPDVRISINLFNPEDFVIGPFKIRPEKTDDGRILLGGANEYITIKPIDIYGVGRDFSYQFIPSGSR